MNATHYALGWDGETWCGQAVDRTATTLDPRRISCPACQQAQLAGRVDRNAATRTP